MAIFRAKKVGDYSVISNKFLRDPNLSLKGKGLLAYFLSKPDDWQFYTNEIVKNCRDGVDSTLSGVNELIKLGYIERVKNRGEDGKFSSGYEYLVYEIPKVADEDDKIETSIQGDEGNSPQGENPVVENPVMEKPHVENPVLLNTKYKPNTENKLSTEKTPPYNKKHNRQSGGGNREIYDFYSENSFGKLNRAVCLVLDSFVKNYSKEALREAMIEAIKNNKYTLSYVEGILKNNKKRLKEKRGSGVSGKSGGSYGESIRNRGIILSVNDL